MRYSQKPKSFFRQSVIFSLFVLLFSDLVALSRVAHAAPGDLDPTFGAGGKVTTDFRLFSDAAFSLALQEDGKIILAGSSWNGPTGGSSRSDFALARYNPDGSLDATFGTDGKVTTDFNSDSAVAFSVAIQPDGKIVAGGGAGTAFALARYRPDGSLDPSFGAGGRVTTPFSGVSDVINAIAIQQDGKIIAAGSQFASNAATGVNNDIALARYNSDGTLDPTFGAGGKVTTHTDPFANEIAHAVALQSDGKIVIAGQIGITTAVNRSRWSATIPTEVSMRPSEGVQPS